MGNQASSALRLTMPTAAVQPAPLQLTGQISRKTHCCSNKDRKTTSARQRRTVSKSLALDLQKHSLLSISCELRNYIYAHLFKSRDYIVLSPLIHTNIPGLVLLRTCKHLHDEAASFFYTMNSFQCYIRKSVLAQSPSTADFQLPEINSCVSRNLLRNPLAIQGGIFFPAPRYHQFLTRLTIYFKVSIRDLVFPDPEKRHSKDLTSVDMDLNHYIRLRSDNAAITPAYMGKMQQAIQHEVFCVYQKMSSLWKEKEGTWAGKVVMPARSTATDELEYWIELTADEDVAHQ
jgi:hypothetical protein